jgi:hypothetical protein
MKGGKDKRSPMPTCAGPCSYRTLSSNFATLSEGMSARTWPPGVPEEGCVRKRPGEETPGGGTSACGVRQTPSPVEASGIPESSRRRACGDRRPAKRVMRGRRRGTGSSAVVARVRRSRRDPGPVFPELRGGDLQVARRSKRRRSIVVRVNGLRDVRPVPRDGEADASKLGLSPFLSL